MHDDDDHSNGFDLGSVEEGSTEEIEGLERFTLRSVGIDIGSSTTHVIFSRLVLRRQGVTLSARYVVTNREVLYRSPILLTPYLTATLIDTDQVKKFIERSYREAGFDSGDIDTGAAVITGEALKKENSRPILEYFSTESGKFICASAGPMHEALLAAYGSGAVALSQHHRNAVLDVDMGGGTTKISLIRSGEIVQMAAVEVGARLLAFDDDMTITRVEQPMRAIAKALGKKVELGAKLTSKLRRQLAAKMADIVFDVLSGGAMDPLTRSLMLTDGLHGHRMSAIDHVVFSGGVSEYVYGHTAESYGDLGPELGREVRQRCSQFLQPRHGCRAGRGNSGHGDRRRRVHAPSERQYQLHLHDGRSPGTRHSSGPSLCQQGAIAPRPAGGARPGAVQVRHPASERKDGAGALGGRAAGLPLHPTTGGGHCQRDRPCFTVGSSLVSGAGRRHGSVARDSSQGRVQTGSRRHRHRQH